MGVISVWVALSRASFLAATKPLQEFTFDLLEKGVLCFGPPLPFSFLFLFVVIEELVAGEEPEKSETNRILNLTISALPLSVPLTKTG